jgi:protein-tyrosine phosphatase
MLYAPDPELAIEFAAESSRTTHAAITAVDACRYFAALIVGALRGASKDELLLDHYSPVKDYWKKHPLCEEIRDIAGGSFRHKEPPAIIGSGYVVRSLEAALWAFHKCSDFREGCLLAANLADDADTTAAVYGQLAGAFYGEEEIPKEWLAKLAMRDRIEAYASRIFELSRQTNADSYSSKKDFYRTEVLKAAERESIPTPIARSYWVIPGKFLAGAYPSDVDPQAAEDKMQELLNAGIRYFINLTSIREMNIHGDPLAAYQDLAVEVAAGHFKINYRRMPITDLDVTTPAQMSKILDVIDGAVLSGIPIYIHCLGGIGRTGTVVGCWLARHGISNGEAVLELIRKLRRNDPMANRPSPETARQCRFVCEWAENE